MADGIAKDGTAELMDAARRALPGGSFGNFAAEVIIAEGRGAHVWDVSGREYIDYLLGSGPMFVGHAHPAVTEAVLAQVPKGTTFFANNPHGIRLAQAIVDAVPCAEQVRFVSSGSEADLYAMRLARAYRGRSKIVKFEGGYHGMSDWGLMSLAPKHLANFPQAVPDSPGIPEAVRAEMLIAPFNDAEAAVRLIEARAEEIGGVILEPFQRLIPPVPGFLEAVREVTARLGIPLIFDEVVTGFRFAYGGAQAYYGVTPDICTLGKIVGGGFPLAVVAGRADIMRHFDRAAVGEAGFLTQIGTLSGNPVASAAGLATLELLRAPGAYDAVFATGRRLMDGMSALIAEAGIPAQTVGEPVLFDVVYTAGEVRDYRATLRQDTAMQKHVNGVLRASGILKGDSKFYISTAHDAADIDRTLEAFRAALASLPGSRGAA
ncbi:aminotransferase class III-fold pyridoxal phosphate-dependent enzyme [Roseomonas sp. PWR1]|uniref:Aminotransferase class III-fold pyridoxal phosphate-dependent enzyme n=1 Tax=Roseomonas nitratireducens TaxID=2820810 RepID=A0ABS4AXX9_9PROT|nr:aminotransferase class III-fold pyridoxal phosphate-dependent enzyme [Neoroseomonas nitratireducens]MBP0465658.1 aminotransferase class III-fold pyridoxal phosphate-dependent enzyme [Neoroseomonas nitratireducens]